MTTFPCRSEYSPPAPLGHPPSRRGEMGKIPPCGGILAPSERGLSAKPTGGVLRGRQIAGNKDAPLGHQSAAPRGRVSVPRRPQKV